MMAPSRRLLTSVCLLTIVILLLAVWSLRSGAVTLCAWPEGSTNALAIFQSSALNELADYIKTLL